jgi:ppGpp synthetase/RelA/SpoT-type nucleotidyltranferase
VDGDAYVALRQRCIEDFEPLRIVASEVQSHLERELQTLGIEVEVSARAKDTDSLLRKLVLRYETDDVERAKDRVGARVVVHMPSDVEAVRSKLHDILRVTDDEDVSERLDPDQFGYRGIHLEIDLGQEFSRAAGSPRTLLGEVQIRTVAEHAWSVLSHLLMYKSPGEDSIPGPMRRRVNRLIALVELFDLEARAVQNDITTMPEFSLHKTVYDVERLHSRTVGDIVQAIQQCSPELTATLLDLYGESDNPSELVATFVAGNREKLRTVLETYDSEISPLLRQPEAFILWERLDHDAVAVAQLWRSTAYPESFLQNMAIVWGVDLPDL